MSTPEIPINYSLIMCRRSRRLDFLRNPLQTKPEDILKWVEGRKKASKRQINGILTDRRPETLTSWENEYMTGTIQLAAAHLTQEAGVPEAVLSHILTKILLPCLRRLFLSGMKQAIITKTELCLTVD